MMMKTLLLRAGALALVLFSPIAAAQVPANTPARAPAGFLPSQASFCSSDNGATWQPCPPGGGGGGSTGPTRATSTSTAGAITAANTYQVALASNPGRNGCLILNKSTADMRIALGASPTDQIAMIVPAGFSFNCSNGGLLIVTDQINIASTTAAAPFVTIAQ